MQCNQRNAAYDVVMTGYGAAHDSSPLVMCKPAHTAGMLWQPTIAGTGRPALLADLDNIPVFFRLLFMGAGFRPRCRSPLGAMRTAAVDDHTIHVRRANCDRLPGTVTPRTRQPNASQRRSPHTVGLASP
jgi:hypothetical protein